MVFFYQNCKYKYIKLNWCQKYLDGPLEVYEYETLSLDKLFALVTPWLGLFFSFKSWKQEIKLN